MGPILIIRHLVTAVAWFHNLLLFFNSTSEDTGMFCGVVLLCESLSVVFSFKEILPERQNLYEGKYVLDK